MTDTKVFNKLENCCNSCVTILLLYKLGNATNIKIKKYMHDLANSRSHQFSDVGLMIALLVRQ